MDTRVSRKGPRKGRRKGRNGLLDVFESEKALNCWTKRFRRGMGGTVYWARWLGIRNTLCEFT